MRVLFAPLAALILAASLTAGPVRLRSLTNGNIIEVEVIEVRAESVSFRLVDGQRTYTAKWETLDLDWIKENSPGLWNERQLQLQPAEPPKPKEDPAADPFAQESPPADTKAILRNLLSSLGDRTKGLSADRVESFCRNEAKLDEDTFWKGYDELRRDSAPVSTAKTDTKTSESRGTSRSSSSSRSTKDRPDWQRDPANAAKEDALRQLQHQGQGGLTGLVYLRALAEGGYKGRLAWQLLRFVPEDKQGIVDRLRKYETQAAELATRAESPDIKRDALVLRKQLADILACLGRVSRENATQEDRLKADCAALLARMTR